MIEVTPYILFVLGAIQVIGLTLTAWILATLVKHEKQLYRLVSDRESEKGTLARVHSDFELRIRALERART